MAYPKGGYAGRFLRVDLSSGAITVEETPDPARWLGSRGWNALIGWNEVGPGVGPFDPENRIVFSAGPLVGAGAPTSGRATVSTLAPLGYPTPMWTWASMGGYWGAELKHAGYDGVVIQGQASAPCYLLIEDDKVSLRDAGGLWGQGALTVQRMLKDKHSRQHQIAAIGPAGENRVRFASIIHRLKNAVGNGGFGGVMGAKNLKAIVVRGTRGFPIVDPLGYIEAVRQVWHMARGGLGTIGRPEQGYPLVACTHGCSVRCGTRMRPVESDLGPDVPYVMTTCNDGSFIGGTGRAYAGEFVDGTRLTVPPAPGFGPQGSGLANLVHELGLTSWVHSTWGRYFATLKEMGITEVLGERIAVDDPAWWRDWMTNVAHRRGAGDAYAEDLARFYEAHPIGPRNLAELIQDRGSRGHGWHREGRMMEAHPSPFWEYSALLYAVSTRDVTPSTHDFFFLNGLYGYPSTPKKPEEIPARLKELSARLYGSEKAVYPGDECIEHVTAWHQYRSVIKDSLGLCDWVFPITRKTFETKEEYAAELAAERGSVYGDITAEATLFRACTGLDLTIEEMERPLAERVVNLERCIEVRNNGRNREADEWVIPHFQWTEKTDGTHLSASADEFRALLDRFYDRLGWDRVTGAPTPETLARLGLEDVALALMGERQEMGV